MRQPMLTFGVLVFVMGCDVHLHPYQDYLSQSIGRADHEAVARQMGAPHRSVTLDKGGDLWTYDFCPSGDRTGAPTCQSINLLFDKSGKLAEWHEIGKDATSKRTP